MKKSVSALAVLLGLGISSPASAQEGFNLMAAEESQVEAEIAAEKPSALPPHVAPAAAAETAEKDGLFSFFNFSFGKKGGEETAGKPDAPAPQTPEETPLQKLTREAGGGSLDAQLTLGYMYLYGVDGVDIDYVKAFNYYKQAAAQGDNVAINNLGSLYYSGIGTERNLTKAAETFEKAVVAGNTEAAVNLGFLYLTGSGVIKDNRKAMELFERAAKVNNPTAAFMLGYAYYRGFIVPQDYKKAFDLIKISADAGYDDAQYVLAGLYLNGWGVPQNYGNAVKTLNKAVAQGNVNAMTALGSILVEGKRYTLDYYTAHILYNLAAVRGAPEAAEQRDAIEPRLKIEDLLRAQGVADRYQEKPSDLTKYISQTFGADIKSYIDNSLKPLPADNKR